MARRSLVRLMPAVLAVPICSQFALAQTIPAFSGADGAAKSASGGRGGIVYHVTKLNSAIDDPLRNDPGTIRYALNNANFPAGVARTIVFDVGGVFNLGRLPQPINNWDPNGNGWDAQSRLTIGGTNVTLAGQSAPGAGVIFMGGGLKPQGNNNIIRNITVAPGYGLSGWWKPGDPFPSPPGTAGASSDPAQWFPDNTVYDAMDIAGTNLLIDHVSTFYSTDETISMNEVANNITVQYSNISQGQNYPQWDAEPPGGLTGHALGSLLEAGSTSAQAAISFHHNLYAHQKARVPQMQAGGLGGYYDFRNNVFYNWFGTAGSKSGTTFLNLANNFYLAGNGGDQPIGGNNPGITTQGGGTSVLSPTSSIYRLGNLLDSNKDGDANDGAALSNTGGSASPLWMGGVATYTGVTDGAALAYDRVLNYMGANWWTRDAVVNTPDERIVNEARTGTGKIIAWADDPWNNADGAEWQALKNTPQTSRSLDWDTEASVGYGVGDGMPTWWEIAHGLDPNARDDSGDFDNDGYTNLEEYLNEIAEWPAPKPLVFTGATNNRYAQITNWDITWQPSRFDEAQIHNGSVVIDAVGQHARLLNIAPTSGDSGVVTLSAGWIDVAEKLQIANDGGFLWTGGQLFVPAVQLSGNGLLKLSGGRDKTLDLTSLSITGSAKLDLSDNRMIVRGGSLATVTGLITSGRNGGSWNGAGIGTSQSDATSSNLTSIGVVRAGDAGISQFAGRTVSANDVLVMYTYDGDANLDGKINVDDYGRIDLNVNLPGASGWYNGDFNYDGKVNVDDYGIIDFNIGIQGAPFSPSSPLAGVANQAALSAIPEPSSLALLALLPIALPRRKRKS